MGCQRLVERRILIEMRQHTIDRRRGQLRTGGQLPPECRHQAQGIRIEHITQFLWWDIDQ